MGSGPVEITAGVTGREVAPPIKAPVQADDPQMREETMVFSPETNVAKAAGSRMDAVKRLSTNSQLSYLIGMDVTNAEVKVKEAGFKPMTINLGDAVVAIMMPDVIVLEQVDNVVKNAWNNTW